MCVIDWNSTCGNPIECSRRWSKRRSEVLAASIDPPSVLGTPPPIRRAAADSLVPGRGVVHPAAGDHRRPDVPPRQLVGLAGERVGVEDDEVREPAWLSHEERRT